MNEKNGWEQLICDFFYTVCLRVLGSYFASLGFTEEKTEINGVVFKRDDIFVEVAYLPESAPHYSPSLIMGIDSCKHDGTGEILGLPVWSVLDENDKARKYSFWKFGDDKELAFVLSNLKIEVIDRHMKRLWEDRTQLERKIKEFSKSRTLTP